jgi:homoserine O-succinyltransferase
MPLIAHNGLPSFDRLREDGHYVLPSSRASAQDIRELHIGFLNIMPDAALEATERQFLRLVGASNRIAQFYVHPFTIDGIERQGDAKRHVENYYSTFAELQKDGLDALIITGANVTEADITSEEFWDPLVEVMEWGMDNVCSVLCSCLTSHAAFKHFYGIDRRHLEQKQWGVYSHRIVSGCHHPLLTGINTRFDTPHSRFNDVSQAVLEDVGAQVLVSSEECGVLCAVSPDGFRYVYLQGHPEYDTQSLLKEYKREVYRFVRKERDDYPPEPEHYFTTEVSQLLKSFRDELIEAIENDQPLPALPEETIEPLLDNTWTDSGKAIVNNWIGLVYQLTDWDRKKPFMDGVDPENPLGLAT